MKLLFVSTPVGPLGSGLGGGVELSLYNIAQEIIRRGHDLQIVAPAGSTWDNLPIMQISGNLQIIAQSLERTTPITMPKNSVLGNMWDYVRQVEDEYDLIVNFAYDWLPFYLTPFLKRPVAHFVSMGSLADALDGIIVEISQQFPGTIGFYTAAQAATFPQLTPPIYYLSSGIDLSLYEFCSQPKQQLAWLGRISPEKGLEDAFAVAKSTNIPLKIMGKIQDESYWQKIQQDYPNAPIEYLGFLSTKEMQQIVRQCKALIMTPRWVEAFGNVAIEALACGVPVISYNRGGPGSIIQDGKTGFLVEPDSVTGLIEATKRLDQINRQTCRDTAQKEFSLEVLGKRFEQWFINTVSS
ncbi:MAG: glycosyltransferase family 4 protein [Richelia sp. RM2_1_2]|nr:glycosyltransferase family 4 protein [Richelia sp. SM2_1_7]NJM18662.1 glycosyltransferase family 4 protein [Richelia sp. SM1_7_0]NJN06473.1 glycosyltransferase family 4 protein [Richelia sp. RM1_1_1]NJO26312.1 glycosyltransferase family 4 protein [Richelia sp. SL_2_1]NJO57020.1 glycosyltransferase family 4 protein [Richelia sp. RM2_1_2]